MNRQASLHNSDVWHDYGDATHVEAARREAEMLSLMWPDDSFAVDTREEGSDVIHHHLVTRRVVFDVVSMRQD